MHWQGVWPVWITPDMSMRPWTKANFIMVYQMSPDHTTIPFLKSIVLISGSKAVRQ